MLEPTVAKLQKFTLYETCSHFYLVGCNKYEGLYRILKIVRSTSAICLRDILMEDPHKYTAKEIGDVLSMINSGYGTSGGLVRVTKAYGIVGFVRFLNSYYMTLITDRRKVGQIAGCAIYTIKQTETFYLVPKPEETRSNIGYWWSKINKQFTQTQTDVAESRYQSLFQFVDLTKDFYYSYMYDLTNTIQFNTKLSAVCSYPPPPPKEMYCWNKYQTDEFEACIGDSSSIFWVLPLIHGGFSVSRFCLPNSGGVMIDLILIGKRSRHFAGTRYLKRGVSDQGKVANDVEVEQIVQVAGAWPARHNNNNPAAAVKPVAAKSTIRHSLSTEASYLSAKSSCCYRFAGLVQMRGSIPVHWTQESSLTAPKPPIVLYKVDANYTDAKLHFSDLLCRYSSPILVLDLVKQAENRPRETIIGKELWNAVEAINDSLPASSKIRYCALDFSRSSHSKHVNVLSELDKLAMWSLFETGFFCSNPVRLVDAKGEMKDLTEDDEICHTEQRGVLRTNCVDCLDRTNVAQFAVGVRFLAMSLTSLGVMTCCDLPAENIMVQLLMQQYTELGDRLALQYGGSEAHKKVPTSSDSVVLSGSSSVVKPGEFLTSIRRYYSNAFTDRVKQDAINLFLGNFAPIPGRIALWDLETDYFLHNYTMLTPQFVEMLNLPTNQRTNSRLKTKMIENLIPASDDDDDDDDVVRPSDHVKHTLSFFPDLNAFPMSSPRLVLLPQPPEHEDHKTGRSRSPVSDPAKIHVNQDNQKLETSRTRKRLKKDFYAELLLDVESEWWTNGINKYQMSHYCMRLPPPETDRAPSFFHRAHKPYKLTSFDHEFEKPFVKPIVVDPFVQNQSIGASDTNSQAVGYGLGFLSSLTSWNADTHPKMAHSNLAFMEATMDKEPKIEVCRRLILTDGKLTMSDIDLAKILLEIAIVQGKDIKASASDNEFQMKIKKRDVKRSAGTIHNADWWSDFLPLLREFDSQNQMGQVDASLSQSNPSRHRSTSKSEKRRHHPHGSVWETGADFISHLFSPFSPFSNHREPSKDLSEEVESVSSKSSNEAEESHQVYDSSHESNSNDQWEIVNKNDATMQDIGATADSDHFAPQDGVYEDVDVPLGGFTQEFLSSPALWKKPALSDKIAPSVEVFGKMKKESTFITTLQPISQYVRLWGSRARNAMQPYSSNASHDVGRVKSEDEMKSRVSPADGEYSEFYGDPNLVSKANPTESASSIEFIAWDTARIIYRYVEIQQIPESIDSLGHIIRGNDLDEDCVGDLSPLEEIKWLMRELTVDENDGFSMTMLGEANGIMEIVNRGPFSGLHWQSSAVDAWKAVAVCIEKEQRSKRYDKLDYRMYDRGMKLRPIAAEEIAKPSPYELPKAVLDDIVLYSKRSRKLKNVDEQELAVWKDYALNYEFVEPKGLCDMVDEMMDQFEAQKLYYAQAIKSSQLSRLKSTLSDDSDIALYSSYYSNDVLAHDLHEVATTIGYAKLLKLDLPIAEPETSFLSRSAKDPGPKKSLLLGQQTREILGFGSTSNSINPILDSLKSPSVNYPNFELIDNDLYVSSSNEYALFNSAALESFSLL